MEFLSKRISVVRSENEVSVVVMAMEKPSQSNTQLFWFILWTICGSVMIYYFFQQEAGKTKTMYLVWIGFWLYFAYLIGRAWMWRRFGRELIQIKNGKFLYKRDTAGRGFVHVYAAERVKNFRVAEDNSPKWLKSMGGNTWNTDCNSVAYDFEDKELQMGYQLDAAEKKALIHLFKKYCERNTTRKESKEDE